MNETMGQILLLGVLAVIVAIFFSIGLLMRKRSRWLQIVVTTGIAVVVFLSITLVGSGIGITVYASYQFEACVKSAAICAAERDFDGRTFPLIVWMTVPKPLRPACETISPEFCLLERSYDTAPYNYIAGAFGAVIVIFFIGQGMRQNSRQEIALVDSTSQEK
jgi:hypothetical protein